MLQTLLAMTIATIVAMLAALPCYFIAALFSGSLTVGAWGAVVGAAATWAYAFHVQTDEA